MPEHYQSPIEIQAAKGRLRKMIAEREGKDGELASESFALKVALQALVQVRRVMVRSKRPELPPLPFSVQEALQALQDASGGRFKATRPSKAAIAIQKLIRAYPDLETWRLVGSWLQAGGDAFRTDLDSRALTSANLSAWVTHSVEWARLGRPPLLGPRGRSEYRPPAQDQVQLDKDVFADEPDDVFRAVSHSIVEPEDDEDPPVDGDAVDEG